MTTLLWYTGDSSYDTVLLGAFLLVGIVVLSAPFVDAPYGRFSSTKYGFSMSSRLGWFLMEVPAWVSFIISFFRGPNRGEPVPMLFMVCLQL